MAEEQAQRTAHVCFPADAGGGAGYADLIQATGALLWPIFFIFLAVLLRSQLRSLGSAVSKRLNDPGADISIGPFELKTRVTELASKVESLEIDTKVATSNLRLDATDEPDAWSALSKLADQYRRVNLKDWRQRVKKKDELSAQMASVVITKGIPRERLCTGDEAMRVALATTIHSSPRPGDDDLIRTAAPGVKLKHVRYRFMAAVARLADLGLIKPGNRNALIEIAEAYRQDADIFLAERITRTLETLEKLECEKH